MNLSPNIKSLTNILFCFYYCISSDWCDTTLLPLIVIYLKFDLYYFSLWCTLNEALRIYAVRINLKQYQYYFKNVNQHQKTSSFLYFLLKFGRARNSVTQPWWSQGKILANVCDHIKPWLMGIEIQDVKPEARGLLKWDTSDCIFFSLGRKVIEYQINTEWFV